MPRFGFLVQSNHLPRSKLLAALAAITAAAVTCVDAKDNDAIPAFREDIAPLLAAHCASCHQGESPAGNYSVASYVDAIGCVADGVSVVDADRSLLTRALARADHASLLDDAELALLQRWVTTGAAAFKGGTHPPGFVDPRSNDSHAKFLRARRYRPMTDATDVDACGSCHEGAPSRPATATATAPGATPCTTCHKEANGPLACNTCHGPFGTRNKSSRDACLRPDQQRDNAHGAHAATTPSRASGLPCSDCHPAPSTGDFTGTHADGYVTLAFNPQIAGLGASYDATTGKCANRCHAQPGGLHPELNWRGVPEAPLACNSCHSSPPPAHYPGPCTTCHAEPNADGTALSSPTLHVNGVADRGNGNGTCGACHGTGDDPWPSSIAHPRHKSPLSAAPVDCSSCHPVPQAGVRHPTGRGYPILQFRGPAVSGGRAATYDPQTKTCGNTSCHYQFGSTAPAPQWTQGPSAAACGTCHSNPPPPGHPQRDDCGTCHLGAGTDGAVAGEAVARHVNGTIDR